MNLIERIETLERIHELIRGKRTGTPKYFAQKLGMSKRSLFMYIELMRHMGAPIEYCKSNERYFYTYEVDFKIGFMQRDKQNKIIGGKSNIFSLVQNICIDSLYF